tara:strand:- start:70 stop:684 length:615 start_codon:yes stop_codon:yes gene_type:complete
MTAILKVDTIQDTAGNNIINESSDTITIGASGDTTNIVGTLQNNGSAVATTNGITVADQWRITAAHDGIGYITANWERIDTDQPGLIGSAMTQSSGVFTFPSTGTYLVTFVTDFDANSANLTYITAQMSVTPDNSNYSSTASASDSAEAGYNASVTVTALVNVNNTTNVKMKFYVGGSGEQFSANGNTGYTRTGVTFIRLGDST